jgi:hypothetical protein
MKKIIIFFLLSLVTFCCAKAQGNVFYPSTQSFSPSGVPVHKFIIDGSPKPVRGEIYSSKDGTGMLFVRRMDLSDSINTCYYVTLYKHLKDVSYAATKEGLLFTCYMANEKKSFMVPFSQMGIQ